MRILKLLSLSLVIFLVGCATTNEYLSVPIIDKDISIGWKLGHQYREPFNASNIREFVPNNESIKNWSKLFTIQFIKKAKNKWDLALSIESKKHDLIKICPNLNWMIIETSNTSIIYEWKIKDCTGHANQHNIGRMFKGEDGLHHVFFIAKTDQLDPNLKSNWLNSLKHSTIKSIK